ncbi:ACT domain-containing protein [Parendozoicomonas sp. Alg238-R29]|uniref:glycine cleavage system protein R n=1 Tax=Parendozoicomonas sp. Alg238-R29 TaxID=2993446 RepID=UPI00248EF464|nr:ACT domain-containing protein [Parendozoicomonas sp. Alg238-R29]
MIKHLVLTVTGPDLPGMEQELTRIVSRHQARWVASRMAHMAGRFASILFVSVATDVLETLTAALQRLESDGITVRIDKVDASMVPPKERHLLLNLIADDAPELVTDISRLLAEQHIRISELHTDTLPAPDTGVSLQSMQAHLRAPAGVDIETVRSRLEALSPELMLDISLE